MLVVPGVCTSGDMTSTFDVTAMLHWMLEPAAGATGLTITTSDSCFIAVLEKILVDASGTLEMLAGGLTALSTLLLLLAGILELVMPQLLQDLGLLWMLSDFETEDTAIASPSSEESGRGRLHRTSSLMFTSSTSFVLTVIPKRPANTIQDVHTVHILHTKYN